MDHSGKTLREFNTGDEIYALTTVPAAGSNREDVVAGSLNGYCYKFSADGDKKWNLALSGGVTRLAALPDGRIAAGTTAGEVALITADGIRSASAQLPGRITGLFVDGQRLRAITAEGTVAVFDL